LVIASAEWGLVLRLGNQGPQNRGAASQENEAGGPADLLACP
jgi:hypothetical protein